MKYMLDTNICIYWLKGDTRIRNKILAMDINNIFVSTITIAELLYGAYNSANIEKNLNNVNEFENVISNIELDRKCIVKYAQIKSKLRAEGKIVDDFDILIAASAIENDCVLVTNNTKHFNRIDEISIENWV